MSFPLSRLMSVGTATYAVYAFARPRHLGNAVDPRHAEDYDLLATTYGARDLAVSSVALLARSEQAVTTAMVIRAVLDVSDGLILAARTDDDRTRQKVLGVTFGWAALNATAIAIDRRRARRARRA